ncbi:MAG: hypothetical protein K2Y32_10505 [Candidatus Obscuribacterales bacterium]|nr:hypothetical protein [Candidatus Obscuribacterales bacterium]
MNTHMLPGLDAIALATNKHRELLLPAGKGQDAVEEIVEKSGKEPPNFLQQRRDQFAARVLSTALENLLEQKLLEPALWQRYHALRFLCNQKRSEGLNLAAETALRLVASQAEANPEVERLAQTYRSQGKRVLVVSSENNCRARSFDIDETATLAEAIAACATINTTIAEEITSLQRDCSIYLQILALEHFSYRIKTGRANGADLEKSKSLQEKLWLKPEDYGAYRQALASELQNLILEALNGCNLPSPEPRKINAACSLYMTPKEIPFLTANLLDQFDHCLIANGTNISHLSLLGCHFLAKTVTMVEGKECLPRLREKFAQEQQPNLFDETTFWAAFEKDLRKAEEKVIIVSPFVRKNRFQIVQQHLSAFVERGGIVEAIISQEPDSKGSLKETEKLLCDAGWKVRVMKGIHQKVAIIDDNICWEGSLNILSFANSKELMRRFESRFEAQAIWDNLRF